MTFDPYHQWLGIRDAERPPNHYRLLGVEMFEADPAVIDHAADRQMAHLRTFQNGPHSDASQQLLNEVAAARVCLLDATKKAVYDFKLSLPTELVGDSAAAPIALGKPGKGPRAEKPWYFWIAVLSPMLVVAMGLMAYRIMREQRSNTLFRELERQTVEVDPETSTEATKPHDVELVEPSSKESETGSQDDTEMSSLGPTTSSGDVPSAEAATLSSGTQQEDVQDTDQSNTTDNANENQKVSVRETPSEESAESKISDWSELRTWDVDSVPASTVTPVGRFLFALSQRDVPAALAIISALEKNPGVGIDATAIDDAAIVWDAYRQFWLAYESAVASLEVGNTLEIGDLPVTVFSVNRPEIEFASPAGNRRQFSLAVPSVEPRIAIAIVQRHFQWSQPVAWRLVATFLTIDKMGNQELAARYGRRADFQGVNWDFLHRSIRRLRGEPELSSPVSVPALTDDAEQARSTSVDLKLPTRDEQKVARQEVLRPELQQLQEQEISRERWGAELFQRATQPELAEAAVYVLLRYAQQQASNYRDVDTAWAVIEELEQRFGVDGVEMKYKALESMARRRKGGNYRRLAEIAVGMSRQAALVDDYSTASRFATMAQTLGRSVGDADYHRYLLRNKKNVLAMKSEYERLQPVFRLVVKHPDDTRAQADLVRFRILTKADFSKLARDQSSAAPTLREQIERDLSMGSQSDKWIDLGESWFRYARSLQRLEKANAYERAAFWLNQTLPEANRDDAIRIHEMLDVIAKVVGRKSSVIDMTGMSPVATSVGFGSFGVNQNPDLENPRVDQLPMNEEQPISHFFWACAPSSIEFVIPSSGKWFTATGIVSASSNDGLRFVVKADGITIYASPIVKAKNSRVPIRVDLPKSVRQLELKVESLNNNLNDHAYWVDPRLTF